MDPGKLDLAARLSRRRCMQIAGWATAGALLSGALPASAASWRTAESTWPLPPAGEQADLSRTFPVTTVNHLSYAASDYAKVRDFYVDLFDMRVVWDDGKGCALEFGSVTAPNGMYIRNAGAGEKPTINHIAYGLPDFLAHKAALKAELERRGLAHIRPDGEVGWICDDPNGYPLNIVAVKDKAMYPGAARPCAQASAPSCEQGWEAGIRNLNTVPKPSGRGFKAYAYSHVVLNVADLAKGRDFYQEMLGMKLIYDQPASADGKRPPQSFLRFGQNTLYLRPAGGDGKAFCNHFAFVVENYDQNAVEAELKRRGLDPKPDSKLAWTIADPDGMRIEVAGWGLPEHIAGDCQGANSSCPGGPRG